MALAPSAVSRAIECWAHPERPEVRTRWLFRGSQVLVEENDGRWVRFDQAPDVRCYVMRGTFLAEATPIPWVEPS